MRDPEKEVERSTASRAPTHNEYTELPASQNTHNTQIRTEIVCGMQYALSRIMLNENNN